MAKTAVTDMTELDSLLDAHFEQEKLRIEQPDAPSLDSLLDAAQLELGLRERTFGETMSDSVEMSLLNASKILPGLWRQIAATGQEAVRRYQFATGWDAGGVEQEFSWRDLGKAVAYTATPAALIPKRFWDEEFKNGYNEYIKRNPLAMDVQDSFANKVFKAPAQWISREVDKHLELNPELTAEPTEGFFDLLTSPRKLAGAVVEALPVLASAGLLTYAGQAPLAFTLMFAAEGQEAYEQALTDGRTEDEAMQAYNIYGLVSAGIEMVQVGQGLKLLKGQKNALKNVMAAKAGQRVADKGMKALTPQWLKTAAAESLEEMAQGQVQETTAKAVYGKKQDGGFTGWLDRRASEGLIAAAISGPLGVPAIGIDALGYRGRSQETINRNVEQIDAAKEAMGFTDQDFDVPKKLGRQHRDIEAFVQNAFGKDVAWYLPKTERAAAFNGWANPEDTGTILLNVQSLDPLSSVSMHEIVHQLEVDDPTGYARLEETVNAHLRLRDYLTEEIRGKFTGMGLDIDDPGLRSELVAEVIGRLSLEQQFLDDVAGVHPTMIAKLGRAAGRMAKSALKRFKGKKARVEEAEQLRWVDSYINDMQSLSTRISDTLRRMTGEAKAPSEAVATPPAAVEPAAGAVPPPAAPVQPVVPVEEQAVAPPEPSAPPAEQAVEAKPAELAKRQEAELAVGGPSSAELFQALVQASHHQDMTEAEYKRLKKRVAEVSDAEDLAAKPRPTKEERAQIALAPKAEEVAFEIDKYRPQAMEKRIEAARLARETRQAQGIVPAAVTATTKEQRGVELRKLEEEEMLAKRKKAIAPRTAASRYLQNVAVGGVTADTMKNYQSTLRSFLGFVNSQQITDLNDVTPDIIRAYIRGLSNKGNRASTINHRIGILSNMFDFLVTEGAFGSNPVSKIEPLKEALTLPRAVSRETVEKIVAQIKPTDAFAKRDKALILTLFTSGIRASEAAGLLQGDISTTAEAGTVYGKGQKQRLIRFTKAAAAALDDYIQTERTKIKGSETSQSVFLSRTGKPLERTAILNIVKKYSERAGQAIPTHVLRHSFATGMLKGGMDIRTLQEMMGHESIETTAKYLKVTIPGLKEAVKKHHPRPSISTLPLLHQKMAEGLKPIKNLEVDLSSPITAQTMLRKGWILSQGTVIPVRPVKFGPNTTWEHFDHAMTAKTTLNRLFETGVVRIARLPFLINQIVFEGNANALNSDTIAMMIQFARASVYGEKVNQVRMELHGAKTRGFATVEFKSKEEAEQAVLDAIHNAKRDLAGMPSISKKGSRKYVARKSPSTTKQAIHAAVGITALTKSVQTGEERLLKMKLMAEQQGAKGGYREGLAMARIKINEFKAKTQKAADFRKLFRQWVQKDLPMELRGRMLRAIESIKTEKSFDKAIAKLVQEIDSMVKRQELSRLKKFLSTFKKKYGRPKPGLSREGAEFKMAPEFSEVFAKTLDAITLRRPLTEEERIDLRELIDYAQQERMESRKLGLVYNPFTEHEIVPALEKFQAKLARQSVLEWDAEFLREFTDSLMTLQAQWEFQRSEEYQADLRQAEKDKLDILAEIESGWRPKREAPERDPEKPFSPWRIKHPWLGIFGRYNYNLPTLTNIVSGMKYGVTRERLALDVTEGKDLEKQVSFLVSDIVQDRLKGVKITTRDLMTWSHMFRPRHKKLPKAIEQFIEKYTPEALEGTVERPDMHIIKMKLDSGATLNATVGEVLDIIMHTRNSYNYKALINDGIVFRDRPDESIRLTPNDIDRLVEALPVKALAIRDIFAEAIDLTSAAVNKVSRRLVGYDLANRDGYWHIRRKREPKVRGKETEAAREEKIKQKFTQETIESRSHWKEIVGGTGPIVVSDAFNNLVETIGVSAEYIGMAEPMRKAAMITNDPDILRLVRQKGYEDYWRDIVKLLNLTMDHQRDVEWYDKWYNKWMRNVTRAIFSFSPRLAIQQWFSVFLATGELGYKPLRFIRGLPDKALQKRIERDSPVLRERFQGKISRELGEVAQVGSAARFFTGKDLIINWPTHMVTFFDKVAILDVWRMVEGKFNADPRFSGMSLVERHENMEYRFEVTRLAEAVIRTSQPTWDVVDRSILGATKNPWAKAATMFHSQREKMVQMLGVANSRLANRLEEIRRQQNLQSISQALNTPEGRQAGRKWATEYGVILLNTALVKGFGVLYGVAVLGRDEDWKDWIVGILADLPGMFYYGDVARDVIISWGRIARGQKTYQLGSMEYPPMRVLTETRLAAYEMGVLVMMLTGMKDASDMDVEKQIRDTLARTWSALNYAAGLPFIHLTQVLSAQMKEE